MGKTVTVDLKDVHTYIDVDCLNLPDGSGIPFLDTGAWEFNISCDAPGSSVVYSSQWRTIYLNPPTNTRYRRLYQSATVRITKATPVGVYSVSGTVRYSYVQYSNPSQPKSGTSSDSGVIIVVDTTPAQKGRLSVALYPGAAVSAGARWAWSEDGTVWSSWLQSGTQVQPTAGKVYLKGNPIPGYTSPEMQTITISANSAAMASLVWTKTEAAKATILVICNPSVAAKAGARWRWAPIGGNYSGWLQSGVVVSLDPGTYTIQGRAVSGYASPDTQLIQLSHGEARTVTLYWLSDVTSPTVPIITPTPNPDYEGNYVELQSSEYLTVYAGDDLQAILEITRTVNADLTEDVETVALPNKALTAYMEQPTRMRAVDRMSIRKANIASDDKAVERFGVISRKINVSSVADHDSLAVIARNRLLDAARCKRGTLRIPLNPLMGPGDIVKYLELEWTVDGLKHDLATRTTQIQMSTYPTARELAAVLFADQNNPGNAIIDAIRERAGQIGGIAYGEVVARIDHRTYEIKFLGQDETILAQADRSVIDGLTVGQIVLVAKTKEG